MDATMTRAGRYFGNMILVAIALASFSGMIWLLWDL